MSKKKVSPEVQAIISAADAGLHATTVKLVEQFLVDHPESQRAWLDLGQALGQLARYDQAEKAFKKVVELSGELPDGAIFGEIGNLYRAKGEFESAIAWYQKQIDTDPNDATGYLYLGNLLMRQGKHEDSAAAFEQALGCEQACLDEVHYSLGLVYRNLGQFGKAKSHFEAALEIDNQFTAAKVGLKDVKSASA